MAYNEPSNLRFVNRPLLVVALLMTTLLPTAGAESGSGTLTVEGIELPAGAPARVRSAAGYVDGAEGVSALTLTAESAILHRYEFVLQDLGVVKHQAFNRTAIYAVEDLQLTFARADGWLGWTATGPLVGEHGFDASQSLRQGDVVLTDALTGNNLDSPSSPGFTATVPNGLTLEDAGAYSLSGAFTFKTLGPDVVVATSANTTTIRTGERESPSGIPTEKILRWVFIEVPDGTLTFHASTPVREAATSLEAERLPALSLRQATGSVRLGEDTFALDRDDLTLVGDMRAAIAPAPPGRGLDLRFDGTVEASGLNAPAAASRTSWLLPLVLGFGLAVALAAGVAVPWYRRREGPGPLSVDQCAQLADDAADAGRYADALEWNLAAQKLAPGSARLKADEGFFRAEMGDLEGALVAYDAAAGVSDDGEPEFLAAALLARRPGDARGNGYLLRALEKNPALAYEALDDPQMGGLLDDPKTSHSLQRALRRADGMPDG